MDIFLNGKTADITLDTEKNLGEVISGIEQWIAPSGSRIKKICVNDKDVPEDELTRAFQINIGDVGKLDISVSPWRELAAEAFQFLYDTCLLYEKAAFDERKQIFAGWQKSSAARFLTSDIPDMYILACHTMSGEGLALQEFCSLIEERLRETVDPDQEISNCETQVKMIAERLEEFPLDMQTGKDQRASETIQAFSRLGEKLFRILFIHKSEGLSMDTFVIDDLPARTFIEEFNTALTELSSTYESRDTVLAGDITEYELAPRLLKFFAALKNITKSGSSVLSEP